MTGVRTAMFARGLPLVLVSAIAAGACAERPSHGVPPETLVVAGARVYTSPTAAALDDAVVVVEDGRIAAIGVREGYHPPPAARVIDGRGRVLTAGFWNSHVHFTEPHWRDAASAPASDLTARLQRMLVRHGFTSVVDAGSDRHVTDALRRRIDSGELAGPRILSAGGILFPSGGAPPPEGLGGLDGTALEIGTPGEASILTRAKADQGVDVVDRTGTIAPGETADLVLLDGDPVDDTAAFGRVVLVVRGGRVIATHNVAVTVPE